MIQLDSSRMMRMLDTVESFKELQKIKDKFSDESVAGPLPMMKVCTFTFVFVAPS